MAASRRPDANNRRSVVFLHIPKTAGTSIIQFLSNGFPAGSCLRHAHLSLRQHLDLSAYDFIYGHVFFDYMARFAEPPCIVTSLREPVQRSLSQYYFMRSDHYIPALHRDAPARDAAITARLLRCAELVRDLDLDAFIERHPDLAAVHFGNEQVRRLCGLSEEEALAAPLDDDLLERAKRNLERCDVIMLTERLAESARLLCRCLGWPEDRAVERRNIGAPRAQQLSNAALESLRRLTALDEQLYAFGCELFERRLAELDALPQNFRPLPSAAAFQFDQPIHGAGWHPRQCRDGAWQCWMDHEASIDLECRENDDCVLRLHVAQARPTSVLHAMAVFANGHALPVRVAPSDAGYVLSADVPGACLRSCPGKLRLAFRVPKDQPASRDPDSGKGRRTGVALNGIELIPARALARPRPMLQRWLDWLGLGRRADHPSPGTPRTDQVTADVRGDAA